MNQNQNAGFNSPGVNPDTEVMSVGQWLLTFLVFLIPCVGIIMYFVWAFSGTGNLNRRNYCRAYLILLAVVIVLYIILFAVFGAAILALADVF